MNTTSNALIAHIRREIEQAEGYISFARFMELALYAPGLGYYSAGAHKFGKNGDFVTAPEISPLFAKCLAKQCQQILMALGKGDFLELGAGSGRFAKDILLELEQLKKLPEHYFILEVSADLRERQQQLLQTECPHLFSRVQWLDSFPQKMSGIIFANEVLDAMPVHCFRIDEKGIKERCVAWNNDTFMWHIADPTTPELTQRIQIIQQECALNIGYESEINLMLPAWINTLADSLTRGAILFFDYGYGRREYYHPDRSMGTLMCHHQHQRHANPFAFVGLQDITAHVDFTQVAENAVDAHLSLAGYTTQASFLLGCGLMELASQSSLSEKDLYLQNQAIKTLTLPSQMGELVKVMALNKDLESNWIGFSLYRRERDL